MKPRILALYYTQSGQLLRILDHLTRDIRQDADIDFVSLVPEKPFPFPWQVYDFFDAMPETVERIPIPMNPLPPEILNTSYDLILLGYQPWFLNPSLPVTSFLKSSEAVTLLKGKPVITVTGCRNMWLHAQEKIKEDLLLLNAELAGNIVLADNHSNIISTLTIMRWAFKGQKEASQFLPEAGVQDADIKATHRFGKPILEHLSRKSMHNLQDTLLNLGAISLRPGLILLEQRGIKNFRFWARFIREKGGPADRNRAGRLNTFRALLTVAIFVLSPISSFTAFLQVQFNRKKLSGDTDYFRQVKYEPGRI